MTARRFFIAPLVLVAILAAGYGILWFVVANLVEDGFRNWVRVQAERGNTVTYAALETGGFPGPIALSIAKPVIASQKAGWQWSAARAVVETRPWNWRRYRLELFGDQSLSVPFAGKRHHYTIQPKTAVLIGEVDDMGQPSRGVLQAVDVTVRNDAAAPVASARSVDLHMNRRTPGALAQNETAVDLTLQAKGIELGGMFETPLGRTIDAVGLVAAVKGALPQTFLREAVDAWRKGGGAIDLNHFQLDWGRLSLRAKGTVAVDERLRPLGALTADLKGYAETLKALERARVLRRRDVNGARLALDLLSRRDEADNRRVVSVPVTAQGGMLYLGPVRLLKLAPIPFPARPD